MMINTSLLESLNDEELEERIQEAEELMNLTMELWTKAVQNRWDRESERRIEEGYNIAESYFTQYCEEQEAREARRIAEIDQMTADDYTDEGDQGDGYVVSYPNI